MAQRIFAQLRLIAAPYALPRSPPPPFPKPFAVSSRLFPEAASVHCYLTLLLQYNATTLSGW